MNRIENLDAQLAFRHPLAETAGARQRFERARKVGGDFKHGLILDDTAAREVALLRGGLPPSGDFAQNAKKSPVDLTAEAKPAPRLERIAAIQSWIDQCRHFLGEPSRPPVLRQFLLKLFVNC